MRVQRVVMPVTDAESWTVVDDLGEPVAPIEAFLAFLSAIERSPATVRAYAVSLKLWFEFLAAIDSTFDRVAIDDVGRFVAWLRAPAPNVVVLTHGSARRGPAIVNRHLAAVFAFYEHHSRAGDEMAERLRAWRSAGRRSYKPFLHHVTKGQPVAVRPVKLRIPERSPRTLERDQVLALVAACEHLRDKFLLTLLAETGMRVGQALGLRHGDFLSRSRELRIVPRSDNANRARAKTAETVTIPVTTALVRLYSEYLHGEYGLLDSDYVFVNLWAEPRGRPMTYDGVAKLVARLRARTGIEFTLHMLRHTAATEMVRAGMAIEVVARLLTHRSSTVTSQTYVHLDADDVRAELVRTAWAQERRP
ncbi:MAG: integrase [Actinobacteria bacterium]|nr:MAG: integrase [Actinomycetota bacterium]